MKNSQKGFVIPLLITIVALLSVGGGVYVYKNNQSKITPTREIIDMPEDDSIPEAEIDLEQESEPILDPVSEPVSAPVDTNNNQAVYVDQELRDKFENGIENIEDCAGLDYWLKDDCYENLAVLNDDITICDIKIEGAPYFKDSCYLKFNEQKADLSTCDKLSEDYQVSGCYSQVAYKTNNINICDIKSIFKTDYMKEECYRGVAVSAYDSSICKRITDEFGQSLCYLRSRNEEEKADISFCEKIKSKDERFTCYNETAIHQSNLEYCEKIDPDYEVATYIRVYEKLRDICVKTINDSL